MYGYLQPARYILWIWLVCCRRRILASFCNSVYINLKLVYHNLSLIHSPLTKSKHQSHDGLPYWIKDIDFPSHAHSHIQIAGVDAALYPIWVNDPWYETHSKERNKGKKFGKLMWKRPQYIYISPLYTKWSMDHSKQNIAILTTKPESVLIQITTQSDISETILFSVN